MKNLLRKEFGLAIHPLWLLGALVFGALALIPQWIYVLIPLYFCWITAPNVLSQFKSNKDNQFSALLPVPRKSIVAARILSFSILELVHIAGIVVFTAIHNGLYDQPNFSLDLGVGYVGVTFLMYAVFNLVLFPMYYRTAERFGLPLIVAISAAMLVAGAAEFVVLTNRFPADVLENRVAGGIPALLAGLILFVVFDYVAYRVSARRFETVQL